MDTHNVWLRGHLGYRREILHRIVKLLRKKARDDRMRRAYHNQRVPVRCCFCNDIGSRHAACARPIFHYHRLSEDSAEFLRDEARDDIYAATGCGRHDHADRFIGVILGKDNGRARDDERDEQCHPTKTG